MVTAAWTSGSPSEARYKRWGDCSRGRSWRAPHERFVCETITRRASRKLVRSFSHSTTRGALRRKLGARREGQLGQAGLLEDRDFTSRGAAPPSSAAHLPCHCARPPGRWAPCGRSEVAPRSSSRRGTAPGPASDSVVRVATPLFESATGLARCSARAPRRGCVRDGLFVYLNAADLAAGGLETLVALVARQLLVVYVAAGGEPPASPPLGPVSALVRFRRNLTNSAPADHSRSSLPFRSVTT